MNPKLLTEHLLAWYDSNRRDLPWRLDRDPYRIWVSEIMLQQTRVEAVIPYYQKFLQRFPDIAALAAAPEEEVLAYWQGLGYYSRARNLQQGVREVMSRYDGQVPDTAQAVRELPGIGAYTAGAILSIAHNKPEPAVDGNVLRVISRLYRIEDSVDQTRIKNKIETLVRQMMEQTERYGDFTQALMELGALVCTPKKPLCSRCPVQHHCRAHRADTVEFRPLPNGKQKKIDIVMACAILRHQEKFFIQQRLTEDIWGGLWEFPGGRLEEGEQPLQAAIREVAEETGWRVADLQAFDTVVHHYTRYRVTLHGFIGELAAAPMPPALSAAQQYAWVNMEELAQYPYTAGHRLLVAALRAGLIFSGK